MKKTEKQNLFGVGLGGCRGVSQGWPNWWDWPCRPLAQEKHPLYQQLDAFGCRCAWPVISKLEGSISTSLEHGWKCASVLSQFWDLPCFLKQREPEMILRSTDPISSLTGIVGNLRTFSEVSRKNRLPRAEIRNWEKSWFLCFSFSVGKEKSFS